MNFLEEYSRIIGLLALTFVLILLLSTPSTLFAKSITMIDTELSHASKDAMLVRAKVDFGGNEHMRAYPNEIGDWSGLDWVMTQALLPPASLGADVMLIRAYTNPESHLPIFFLILQSNSRSSFHPPIVCYPALGYTIEEEGNFLGEDRNFLTSYLPFTLSLFKRALFASRACFFITYKNIFFKNKRFTSF